MTDFIDSLLTSMSSKFNQETNSDLKPINFNEDKTLKWRGLHNNQYAAVKKRKDGKKSEKTQQSATATTTTNISSTSADDPPPLMNDSVSVSSNISSCSSSSAAVNADDVATAADVTKVDVNDTNSEIVCNEKTVTTTNTQNSASNDTKPNQTQSDKNEKTNNNYDKDKVNDDQRPTRRTLRRKQNADDASDDVNFVSQMNRKGDLRPKRQSSNSAGSISEHRSVSPKSEEKSDKMNTNDAIANRNSSVMTRRSRARKADSENSMDASSSNSKTTVDETNENTVMKTRNERKNSIASEIVEDGSHATPPKLRRSERTLHSSASNDHKDQNDERMKSIDVEIVATEQKTTEKETITRSRKRTIDEKKSMQEIVVSDIKDEKIDEKCVPSAMEVDATIVELDTKDEIKQDLTKTEDIEINNKSGTSSELVNADDQLPSGSDANMAIPRKRGRKPVGKAKNNLKLNMTISTRNSSVKKSPRFSSDESPFCYSIPKKDKVAAEQQVKVQFYFFCFFF